MDNGNNLDGQFVADWCRELRDAVFSSGRKTRPITLLAMVFSLLTAPALADDPGPVGKWLTIDERTGAPGSMVEITSNGGTLQGKLVEFIPLPGQDPNTIQTVCTECKGALKDKPKIGMVVMWNLKRDGDAWDGGTILDTGSGSTYSVGVRLANGGRNLVVHAYLGLSIIGKTFTWVRAK